MPDDRLPGGHAVPGEDVEDARRKQVGGELRQPKRCEGSPFGRLEDDAVARRQRRPDLPHRHVQRVVPRRDQAGHTDGLAPEDAREALDVLTGGPPLQETSASGEETKVVRDDRKLVGHGQAVYLADVLRLDPAQLLGVLVDPIGQLEERIHPILGRRIQPGLLERALGRCHRAVHVPRGGLGDLRDHLAGRRADDGL